MQGEAAVERGQTAEAKLAAAHRALLDTPGIQFDFKGAPEPPKPPAWLEAVGEFLAAIAPAMVVVFWAGVAAAVLFILYLVAREFAPESWFRRRSSVSPVADWRPDEATAKALLEDADRLAETGRFEEAIHALLFRSIDDLVSRRPGAVRPALTSRDIAGLTVLPPTARAAFMRLAQSVERTFFGGRPAGPDEFQTARADYQAFAFAEGWR
ncbi:MAG: DUF4129 domain-containing protein [Phenylobacterium sp.]|nr:DUF4129 domain-containing protein [Phenylobacterium sp.]